MAKKQKQEEPENNIEFPYTVQSLADRLDLEPASVRVKLRNADIPKNGKMYGWKTKREFEEVVKELESTPANGASSKPAKKAKKEPDPPPKKAAKKTLKRKSKSEGAEASA